MDDDVLVTVKDNGAGIPQDKLASIFDMFTQVDRIVGSFARRSWDRADVSEAFGRDARRND